MPYTALKEGFREFLDAAADALLVVDGRGSAVALNPEAERIFGFGEAELVDEPLNRLIPPRFRQLIRSPQPGRSDHPVRPAARRDRVSDRVQPEPSGYRPGRSHPGHGSRPHPVAKAQEALYREKEQAFVTLSSIADGIITTDRAGTVTYMNPTAERVSGWRTTEALGQPGP